MKITEYIPVIAMLSVSAVVQTGNVYGFDTETKEMIADPTPAAFSVCFNHSCASIETVSISAREWERVTAPLQTPALSAAAERAAIADVIANMEMIVGPLVGTDRDLGRNLRGFGKSGQMDCIDESTNTTTYLYMLGKSGYLKWHTLLKRSTRFGIFAGMPHTTAVIQEDATGNRFSVDSWFFDNGVPPAVVELSAWKKGWNPGDLPR